MDNLSICMESVNNNIGIKETLSKVPSSQNNDSLVFQIQEFFPDETCIYQSPSNVPQEKDDLFSWLSTFDTYSTFQSDNKVSNPVKCFPYVDYETASQTVCIDTRTYTRPKKRGLRNALDSDTQQYPDISMQLNTHMPEYNDYKLLDSESIIEYSLTSSYINEFLPSTPLVTRKVNELTISDQENGLHNIKTFNTIHDLPNFDNIPSSIFNNTHDFSYLANVSSPFNHTHDLPNLDNLPSSAFNNTHDVTNPTKVPSAFNNTHDLTNPTKVPSAFNNTHDLANDPSAFNITHDLTPTNVPSAFNNTHDLTPIKVASAFNNTHDLPNLNNLPSAFNNTHNLPNLANVSSSAFNNTHDLTPTNVPLAFNNTHDLTSTKVSSPFNITQDLPNLDNLPSSAFNNTHDVTNPTKVPSAFNNTHDLPNRSNVPSSAFNNTHNLPNLDNVPSTFNNTHDLPNLANVSSSALSTTHDLPIPNDVPSTSSGLPPTIIPCKQQLEETFTNITSSESECEPMSTNSDSSGTFIKSNKEDSSKAIKSDTFNRKSLKEKRQLTFDKDSPPPSPGPDIPPVPDIGTEDNILERSCSKMNVTFELNENVNFLNETFDFSQKFISTPNNEEINKKSRNSTFNKEKLLSHNITSATEPKMNNETNNITSQVNVQSTPAASRKGHISFPTPFTNLSPIRPVIEPEYVSDHSDASSSDDRPNSSKSSISPAGSCDLLPTVGVNIKTRPQLKLIPRNNYQPKSEPNLFSRPLGLPKRGGASGLRPPSLRPPSISVARANPVPDTIKGIPRLQRPSSSIPRPPSRIPAPRGRSHLPTGISQFSKRTTEK